MLPEGLKFEVLPDSRSIRFIDFSDFSQDSITVCFEVLPFDLAKNYQNRSPGSIDSTALFKINSLEKKDNDSFYDWTDTEGIDKTGSLSRGIVFGNRQSVFVNSAMNLQLSGMITEGVELTALITDTQVPYQPEGNTQQIQDFDRVLIELNHADWQLQAGDVVMQEQDRHFLKYYKNVQGVNMKLNRGIGDWQSHTRLGAAIAKGKFASVEVQALEGVLGPYRLKGPSGERFIMILANSEKVFLDGRELRRGFDADYVIDYNSAEFTFTNSVMITKYSRIRVDFEYADQNYSRSNLNASQVFKHDRGAFFVNFYREKDNPYKPLFFDLSEQEMQALSELPSDQVLGQINGADSIGFSHERNMYMKTDTVVNGVTYESVFVFSGNPEKALYSVVFTEVGEGNGNYRVFNDLANGRVFEWIAPSDDGVRNGNFEAIRILPLPSNKQMLSMGGELSLSQFEKVNVELALSNRDLNQFSSDNDNNTGQALRLSVQSYGRHVGKTKWLWDNSISYETTSLNFEAIDRFRTIEFDRDWGYSPRDTLGVASDHILSAQIGMKHKEGSDFIQYQIARRDRDDYISGWQQRTALRKKINNWVLSTKAFWLDSRQASFDNDWKRMFTELHYVSRYLVPGYRFELDQNILSDVESGLAINSAMYFSEHTFFLRSNDSLKWQWEVNQKIREDSRVIQNSLLPADHSGTSTFLVNSPLVKGQQLGGQFIYRNNQNMLVDDSARVERSLSTRLQWNGDFFKRSITASAVYTLANSRELNRAFYFQQVGRGMGTHSWRDLNENGIQEINEFFIDNSPYGDRDYVKIFIPTDEYILAFSSALVSRISIKAPASWHKAVGVKKILSRFSNVSSWSSTHKTLDDRIATRLKPWVGDVFDPALLSFREQLRSTLFFNRGNSLFGWEGSYQRRQLKQYLYSGSEYSKNNEFLQAIRWRLFDHYNFQFRYVTGEKQLWSDFQPDRNFDINYSIYKPEISWQLNSSFRLATVYSFAYRRLNTQAEQVPGYSAQHDSQFEMRWMKFSKMSIQASAGYVHVDFEGNENSAVGFELLQALRPGDNFVWNIQWQQEVWGGLQLTFQYFGRKSPGAETFQSGNVQLAAVF